ncbi:MAG: hypothetical protein U0903_08240 [Planctomycetales bacterium]
MWWKTKDAHLPGEDKRQVEAHAPACGEKLIDTDHSHPSHQIHHVETVVRNMLLRIPHAKFSNLVIHRVPHGVCLEGRMETDAETPDVCTLLMGTEGIDTVVNRLTVEHETPRQELVGGTSLKR